MTCHYCGKAKELRPYGPQGSMVCFDCAMATPERKLQTEQAMATQLNAIKGVAVIGTELGPYPLENNPELAKALLRRSDS